MKLYISLSLIIAAVILASCGQSQQAVKTSSSASTQEQSKKDSLYVFDQVPTSNVQTKQDTALASQPAKTLTTYYVVQIGAFSTKERADEFAEQSRNKIKGEIVVKFDNSVNLYVVRVAKDYTTHEEAEQERNEIWKTGSFSDAWIATEQK